MKNIFIKKPLYDDFVYIRESILDEAIRYNEKIMCFIPGGEEIIDPIEWKSRGKVMKKIFKFKDNPMILYGNHLHKREVNEQLSFL